MQVVELYQLTQWIIENIENRQVPQKYTDLQNILQQNLNQSPQSFSTQKKELLDTIKAIPLNMLSNTQLQALEDVGIGENVGEAGVVAIDDVFINNALDIANANTIIQQMSASIAVGVAWAKEIAPKLEEIIEPDEIDECYEGEIVVRVRFTADASINNIADFKKWAGIWYDITRGVSMSLKSSPEDVRVIGASTGSLITILAVSYAYGKALSALMKDILSMTEQVMSIRLQIEQLKKNKLDTKAAEKVLQETIKAAKKSKVEDVLITALGKPKKNATDGETRRAFEKAAEKLIDFLDKGGEIDFVLPPSEEEDEEGDEIQEDEALANLRATIKGIRQIERKIELIEYNPETDD